MGRIAPDAAPEPIDRTASPLRAFTSVRLMKIGKLVTAEVERALEPLGVKPRHFNVLATISMADALSQQEMSRLLEIDPNVMVGVIDDLEQGGLAERRRNPADRRRHLIVLTDRGRQVLERGAALRADFEDRLFGDLDPGERAALHALTARLLDQLAPPPRG